MDGMDFGMALYPLWNPGIQGEGSFICEADLGTNGSCGFQDCFTQKNPPPPFSKEAKKGNEKLQEPLYIFSQCFSTITALKLQLTLSLILMHEVYTAIYICPLQQTEISILTAYIRGPPEDTSVSFDAFLCISSNCSTEALTVSSRVTGTRVVYTSVIV